MSRFNGFNEEEIHKYRQNFIRAMLRRGALRWPWRTFALQKARIRKGTYVCAECKKIVLTKDKQLDHKDPVVTSKGFTNWDDYLRRLLVNTDGWQVLCTECHKKKSITEAEMRKKARLERKPE